jgi:uncharacterized protein
MFNKVCFYIISNIYAEKAIFSEVKGPGDRLSDKQTIWIDLLNACGAQVELCHVVEKTDNDEEEQPKTKKKKNKSKKTSKYDDDQLWSAIQEGIVTFSEQEKKIEIEPKKNALQVLLEESRIDKENSPGASTMIIID